MAMVMLHGYRDDFIMESGKFKNIMEEVKFKLERNTSTYSSSEIMDSRFEVQSKNISDDPIILRKDKIRNKKARLGDARIESNKVFIVHGHDEAMKQTIARFVENLGLRPIILHEQPGGSSTIIEKFEEYSDVSFAIILFSPDDIAHLNNKSGVEKYRARQNVIFELGYFIGKLNRKKVVSLCREPDKLDLPSDYHGVIYIEYDLNGGWKSRLFRELKACYNDVDANKVI